MKVKNIMFSGFAAAILMGVAAEANAAPATKVVASKGYVDAVTGQLDQLGGAASGKANLVDAVNVKLDPVAAVTGGLTDGEYYSSVTQTTDGQVAVSKGELATEIAENVKKAPTTDAVYQAIKDVSEDIQIYQNGTDINIDDQNKVNATYDSLDYYSINDTANAGDKVGEGGKYIVAVKQENGLVSVLTKDYVDVITDDIMVAPTSNAVYDALAGKQNALDTDQLAAVNSGIDATKVQTYDGYATSKQNALDTDQLAAVNSGITAEKVADFEAKQDALGTAQLAAVNSGITATKVQKYDAIPVMPAACQEQGVVCVLSSEEGTYMWSVLAQPYAYTSGQEATVTDGLTAQAQKINANVNQ